MAPKAAALGSRAPKAQLLGLAAPVTAGWMVGGVRMMARKAPEVQPKQEEDKLKLICNFPGCGASFYKWTDLSAHWGTKHAYGGFDFCRFCGNKVVDVYECKTFLERCPMVTGLIRPSEFKSLSKQTAREQQQTAREQQLQKSSGKQQKSSGK